MKQNRKIPPSQKANNPTKVSTASVEASFSRIYYAGPIPRAVELLAYEKAFPGCAKILIEMAQRQADHRRGMETIVVAANVSNEQRGQWMAFILGILSLTSGVFLIWKGKDAYGLGILMTEFFALTSIFIYGKHMQRKDLQRKSQTVDSLESGRKHQEPE